MYKKIKNNLKNFILSKRSYRFFIKNWEGIKDISAARNLVCATRHSKIITPEVINHIDAKCVLIVAPHPDDELIGTGGAVIKCLESGAEVNVLYLTRGSKKLSERVCAEVKEAAEYLGYKQHFLDFYANDIKPTAELLESFSKYIDNLNPDILFIPYILDDHDDHCMASHLLYLSYKDQLKWRGTVWAYQVYTTLPANIYLNITDVIDKKKKSIAFLASQLEKRDWIHYAVGLNAFNSRFSNNINQKYLESYFVIALSDYIFHCKFYFGDDSVDKICNQSNNFDKHQVEA